MKTAVEFLVKEFSDILGKIKTEKMQDLFLVDAIKQAKEMEKEQIINAYIDRIKDTYQNRTEAEQYYNQTFKKS